MRFGEIAVEGGDGIESALARQVLHVDALIAPRQFVNPCARCLDAVHIDEIAECYDDKTAIICSTDYYAFQAYVKAKNVKIAGFDNLDSIEKYKINIDSVGYSVPKIARSAVDIIVGEKKCGVIVKHSIIEHIK